jgi:hypothetical protein
MDGFLTHHCWCGEIAEGEFGVEARPIELTSDGWLGWEAPGASAASRQTGFRVRPVEDECTRKGAGGRAAAEGLIFGQS